MSTAKLKIHPHHLFGALKAKITHNFWAKINTKSGKKWLRLHHLHPLFKNFPERSPHTPTCTKGYPPPGSRTLPLLCFAPIWWRHQQWTLWVRHCTDTWAMNYQVLVKYSSAKTSYSLSHIVQIMDFFDFLHKYCEEKSETFTEF